MAILTNIFGKVIIFSIGDNDRQRMFTYTVGKKITFNSFSGRKLIYFKNHKKQEYLDLKNLHVKIYFIKTGICAMIQL